jgi:ubiquinol-cytochrome c reductase iron-sulfur subunit
VTSSAKFREVWHNTDSIDPLYDLCKKPRAEVRYDPTRRAHFYLMWAGCYGTGVVAARNSIQYVIHFMWKPLDVVAMGVIEIKISEIPLGECITVQWKDSPVFIWHRNAQQIADAEKDDGNPDLRDPEIDADRVKTKEWYISMAICTHLGCIPIFNAGDYKGFFCPCHGSHYDASGRIRKGPAPTNLEIPKYKLDGDSLFIG